MRNHKGRSDLEVRAAQRYFVFELKYCKDGSPAPETLLLQAERQIIDNHYGDQNCPALPHIRIATVFSQKARCFTHRKVF